jgi:hypothetical protein
MASLKLVWFGAALLWGCGNSQHGAHEQVGSAGGVAGLGGEGGEAGGRQVVLAPADAVLPVCDAPLLEVSGADDGTENWQKDRLLWPTSWQTFRGEALRGPIDFLTGIWLKGSGSEPFEDREVRPLSNALIASRGRLLCAAGEARAVRNGSYAAVELGGLGALTCSGEVVSGELRYCHDCRQGSYAITGTLEGESVVEVTGGRSRVGDTLYLHVGWSVLIAKLAQQNTTETLVAGAYLSRDGDLYCFDSASGDAHDIATADITFTGFRRADPCRAGDPGTFARACVPQFEAGSDW